MNDVNLIKTILLAGIDEKVDRLTTKIDAITGVYDDLHEKMHEIDKTRYQFHEQSTSSFYKWRSQKRKKISQVVSIFLSFWDLCE